MFPIIHAVRFINYKNFTKLNIRMNDHINIFVGDNGVGKSSILQGIDLVLSGSIAKVQSIGLENLININAVDNALKNKTIDSLPRMIIEICFQPLPDSPQYARLYGEKNSCGKNYHGVKLICEPNPDFQRDILSCINEKEATFPYDLYSARFTTFSDEPYNSYTKPVKAKMIDNSIINTEYTLKNVIKDAYGAAVTDTQKITNRQNYKTHIKKFTFDGDIQKYGLCITSDLEDNLDIRKSGIRLSYRGMGEINLLKTKYAFEQTDSDTLIFFLEEPENHLSYYRTKKLLNEISKATETKQIFITTHCSQIASRLGLENVHFLGQREIISLHDISEDTAAFFMKATTDNLLQFILSEKVILVEGAAEYILMEQFVLAATGKLPEDLNIWIIALNNLSFARYLELAQKLKIKVAAIRDNDGKPIERYKKFWNDHIKVFSDHDISRHTFEICFYQDNQTLCNTIFVGGDPQAQMLGEKAEAAYKILCSPEINTITVPRYIYEAIEWLVKNP